MRHAEVEECGRLQVARCRGLRPLDRRRALCDRLLVCASSGGQPGQVEKHDRLAVGPLEFATERQRRLPCLAGVIELAEGELDGADVVEEPCFEQAIACPPGEIERLTGEAPIGHHIAVVRACRRQRMEERGLDGRVAELSGKVQTAGGEVCGVTSAVGSPGGAGELGVSEGSQARRTRTGSEVDHPLTLDDAGVVLGPIHQSQRAAESGLGPLGIVVERVGEHCESVEICVVFGGVAGDGDDRFPGQDEPPADGMIVWQGQSKGAGDVLERRCSGVTSGGVLGGSGVVVDSHRGLAGELVVLAGRAMELRATFRSECGQPRRSQQRGTRFSAV